MKRRRQITALIYKQHVWKHELFSAFFNTEIHCDKEIHNKKNLSRGMRFPTMWYVRPTKPQISLRIRAV